ncbi:hypothetical protein KFL_000090490 [Klebsormidium nitens]|uniref:RWP-RK domain-containing protein n=1 Tax=Klebsormidium nitens TaxID=105231 RepID=A0A1Y1HJW3_KLENI|nr:hypothetical protein KFL_000090490 [Klebsormidium nitens]|eukprot:GAQ78203.1 hypothetical protein KFL_000090490 [Klebsormidium nitens]
MTLLHRPVAQLGSPAHVECWKGGCNCLEGSGRTHLLKQSSDLAGTSKVRTPPQTPPGSPFQIRGASVLTNLPSPQQNDLNAIDCDFLDDDPWPGISENSEGRYVLNNESPSGGLEDMFRHPVLPVRQMEATAEVQTHRSNGFYERALIPLMRRSHSPTLGLLTPQPQNGTTDNGPDLQSCFSAWNTRPGFHLSSARPSVVPSNGDARASSNPSNITLSLSRRSPDPIRQAQFEAESSDPSASESDTPRIGARFKAPSETGGSNPGLNLVGRLRPGFDGLPARPRKLRMMRSALGAHSPPRPRAREEGEDDGDRGLDNSSGGEDGSDPEGDASGEERGGDADVSDGVDDMAADVDEEDSEYDPEEGSESESEYDPDEDEEERPTKKPRSARGPSLARSSSSQSLAGSEGSGGVFPPRKKGRFTEEMDRVFLQRLGELFRQKVMLKDSFRYFPGRTPRQLRRHWMRVKHKYGIGSIKNVENVLARLGPLKKEKDPLSLRQLSSYFKLPMEEACARFNERRGQQLTFQKFRQLFQKHGISRWPYRQVMAGKPISEVITEAKAAVQETQARHAAAEQVPEFLPEGGAELALPGPPANRAATSARQKAPLPGVTGHAKPGGRPRLVGPPSKGAAIGGNGHAKVKSGKHAAGRRFPLAHKPAAAEMPALEEQPPKNAPAGRGRTHKGLMEGSVFDPKKRSRSRK